MRVSASLVASFVSLLLVRSAYAEQTSLAPEPMPALPAPASAPAAASSPSLTATASGGYSCVLGRNDGLGDGDARTTLDSICGALSSQHAPPGTYDVRIGTLGKKILLVVSGRESGSERRVFVDGPEEVPTAAERIATALFENKTVAETQGVDNVVSSEVAAPPRKVAPVSIFLGATAASAVGFEANTSAGAEADLELRTQRLGVALQGRAGGISSGDNFLGFWSTGTTARYYLSDAESAVFVGGGPSLLYMKANEQGVITGYEGLGIGATAEVGASFYRASRTGVLVALRADVPCFQLKNTSQDWSTGVMHSSWMYVASGSLTFGLTFR